MLKFDREQYRDRLAELERRAKALPEGGASGASGAAGGATVTPKHDQSFWMYAFCLLVRPPSPHSVSRLDDDLQG